MNKFYLVIILALALLNFFVLKLHYSSGSSHLKNDDFLKKEIKEVRSEKTNLLKILTLQFEKENSLLFNGMHLKNENNKKFELKKILGSTPKLVLSLPDKVCNVCYEPIFLEIKKITTEIPETSFITLVALDRLREVKKYYIDMELNSPIFATESQSSFNSELVPLFFMADSTLVCKNAFFPDQYNIELTTAYLNTMKKRYFQNQ